MHLPCIPAKCLGKNQDIPLFLHEIVVAILGAMFSCLTLVLEKVLSSGPHVFGCLGKSEAQVMCSEIKKKLV